MPAPEPLRHFKLFERRCRCERKHPHFSYNIFDFRHLVLVDELRERWGSSLNVLRGYSCWPHHVDIYRVRGIEDQVTRKSGHIILDSRLVCATDISPESGLVSDLANMALQMPFTGIGIGSTSLHVDNIDRGGRVSVWKYTADGQRITLI